MATALKSTPIYEDQLIAWHNQRLWWLLCGSGGLIVALVTALCIIVLRPQHIPYVVEVNDRGEPTGIVQPFQGEQAVSENTIRWELSEYIREAFTISRNFDENKLTLGRVYALSTGQATEALTSFYRTNHDANNPLTQGSKYWQDVQVIRTLKLPADYTYQVDYIVKKHDYDHPLGGAQTAWRATMRVLQGKTTANNPLGLWVDNLDFSPDAK